MDGPYGDEYGVNLENLWTDPCLFLALNANNTDGFDTLLNKSGLFKDFWYWKPLKEFGIFRQLFNTKTKSWWS